MNARCGFHVFNDDPDRGLVGGFVCNQPVTHVVDAGRYGKWAACEKHANFHKDHGMGTSPINRQPLEPPGSAP